MPKKTKKQIEEERIRKRDEVIAVWKRRTLVNSGVDRKTIEDVLMVSDQNNISVHEALGRYTDIVNGDVEV